MSTNKVHLDEEVSCETIIDRTVLGKCLRNKRTPSIFENVHLSDISFYTDIRVMEQWVLDGVKFSTFLTPSLVVLNRVPYFLVTGFVFKVKEIGLVVRVLTIVRTLQRDRVGLHGWGG